MDKEITEAITELKQAEQNFNYANSEFIEVATLQLEAAEVKVNALLKIRKQNGPSRMDPCVREKPLTKIFELIIPQMEHVVKKEIQVQIVNPANSLGKRLTVIGKNF